MVTVSSRYCFILTMDTQKEQWMEETIQRYRQPLLAFAHSILRDSGRAQDVVQDTFSRLWKQDSAEMVDKLAPWLFTVCRNQALKTRVKEERYVYIGISNSHENLHITETSSPAENLDLKEQLALLATARKKLSNKRKKVLSLRYDERLSYKEISEKTGLSATHIGFILNETKRRLRADMLETAELKTTSVSTQ